MPGKNLNSIGIQHFCLGKHQKNRRHGQFAGHHHRSDQNHKNCVSAPETVLGKSKRCQAGQQKGQRRIDDADEYAVQKRTHHNAAVIADQIHVVGQRGGLGHAPGIDRQFRSGFQGITEHDPDRQKGDQRGNDQEHDTGPIFLFRHGSILLFPHQQQFHQRNYQDHQEQQPSCRGRHAEVAVLHVGGYQVHNRRGMGGRIANVDSHFQTSAADRAPGLAKIPSRTSAAIWRFSSRISFEVPPSLLYAAV